MLVPLVQISLEKLSRYELGTVCSFEMTIAAQLRSSGGRGFVTGFVPSVLSLVSSPCYRNVSNKDGFCYAQSYC